MTIRQARVSPQSPQALEDSGPINTSVATALTLDPLKRYGGYAHNVTHLYSTTLGHQNELLGREAPEEINITFILPAGWSSDDCALHIHCKQKLFTSFMTLTATPGPINTSVATALTLDPLKRYGGYAHNVTHLYSTTLGHQNELLGREAPEEINITFILPAGWSSDDCALHIHCKQKLFTSFMTLTATPEDDHSLINLHIMHTGYFFLMVVTMFCYAVIKGRPSALHQSSPEFCSEKVPLADA
ncbi:hypothetical protein PAL_GLEAN10022112 [Pteropus alecto]|uniref:Transmembrane protein 248 n=1 Tax=Pteropus alecto TaxID=9402 RepID=L5KAE3_PTEAL|nr:hypothetical protein PAL_GLEAN10022112 [Pteropus alecto]